MSIGRKYMPDLHQQNHYPG